eukprot:3045779-Amphidinium_carterae.1
MERRLIGSSFPNRCCLPLAPDWKKLSPTSRITTEYRCRSHLRRSIRAFMVSQTMTSQLRRMVSKLPTDT